MRISPRTLSAALLAATFSLPLAVQGQIVHFGNFDPGTAIKTVSDIYGNPVFNSVYGVQASAVSFTVGAQPIQISTVDLALNRVFGDAAGFSLAITASDLPTTSPSLLTFSTTSIPQTPSRVSFTADAAVTLAANTTYYLQLTADSGTSLHWHHVLNDTPILSDYSAYNFTYGHFTSYPDENGGGYYITATTAVPEPGEVGLVFGGVLLAGAGVRAWRRQRGCAA